MANQEIRSKGIQDMAEEDRPRERLLRLGADKLKDSELLAILIGSGSDKENAVELMNRILQDYGGDLDQFARISYEQLLSYRGIGEAKAITLLAALELGNRRATRKPAKRQQFTDPDAIYHFLRNRMSDVDHEVSHVILLDQHLQYMADRRISEGGLSSTVVDPRMVLKYAISHNAAAIVLAHNHPSGAINPSREDDNLTARMQRACEAVGIRFIDHIIVSGSGYYSYSSNGKI
ncbi:MAG: DNA repair protein RadC [Prevotellaceae bacterium]|nr:DNA repair protein RadC [Prevotellaceae bacterium]MDY3856014.1 DNA repair protein RadC [Bacteroidaceae bacterium]